MISLGGGLPSSAYFPFQEFSLKVPQTGHFSEEETAETGVTITVGKHDQAEGKSLFDISTGMNYTLGAGAPQILRWVIEHTQIVHNPKYNDWQCTMTIGNTSALDVLLRMLGRKGTNMLSEEYTFASAVETALPLGIKTTGVPVDDEGLLPDALDHMLTNWDPSANNDSPKPYLLYTVPTGQNPTGATQSASRRRALYAIAQKHDLIILEDEPYYFLQMQPYLGQDASSIPQPSSHEEFLSGLVPSLLSMDTDGRVIRMDSFSKVIAPGTRMGWITAPTQIVQRYQYSADVSTQGPCGFSQLALYKLLDEHWGHAGYLDWLMWIQLDYTKRRDNMLGACEKYLPREVTQWKPPMAGMFHWFEVDWHKHPLAGSMSMRELEERIWQKGISLGSLVIKGGFFRADQGRGGGGPDEKMFFRMTYAAAPADKIYEAVRRFGQGLREEFELMSNGHTNGTSNGH